MNLFLLDWLNSPKSNTYIRLMFALMAAYGALLMGEHVYLKEYLTTDENSYIFQAWLFLQGKLSLECPSLKDAFFHRMLICDEQAGWLSRYAPAQAVWLMPGVLVGFPRLMTAIAAFITLWFLTKAGERLKISIWITAPLLLVSPFFWYMQGSVLSHTSAIAATAIMVWAYIVWRQEQNARYAAIAGLAWAFIFLGRSYTAIWIAIPFVIDSLSILFRTRTQKELMSLLVFAGCASVGGILLLFYNNSVTGSPFKSTFLLYGFDEGLGFGIRHGVEHTPARAWRYLLENLALLNVRLWGFTGSLFVWFILAVSGWKNRMSFVFISATILIWIAYFFFWFQGVDEVLPNYYYETLVFMVLGAGLGITRLLSLDWRMPKAIKILLLGLVAVFVIKSGLDTFKIGAYNIMKRHDYKSAFQKVIRGVPPGSIVILGKVFKDIMAENSWNQFGLDSDPLIVREIFGVQHALYYLFPNRPVYEINGHFPEPARKIEPFDGKIPVYYAERMGRKTGKDIDVNGDIKRVAMLGQDKKGYMAYGYRQYYLPGTYEVTYFIDAQGAEGEEIGHVEISRRKTTLNDAKHLGRKTIKAGDTQVALRVNITEIEIAEPQIYYSGKGKLVFDRIETKRIDDAEK